MAVACGLLTTTGSLIIATACRALPTRRPRDGQIGGKRLVQQRGGGQEPTWPQSPAKLRVLGLGGALSRHAHPREARRASTVTACAVASMRSILTSGTRNQPTAVKAAEISTRAV